jgi:transglutaminase/protease-like cytokinesis protein 3
MKIIVLFLCILICCSKLIDHVRKDIVNKALLNLPKKENLDILKMCLEMSKFKSSYSLKDEESAYLVYKWIILNIEYDSIGENQGNSTTNINKVYKTGKGGSNGISKLFKKMCNLLKIKGDIILGLTKTFAYGPPTKIIIQEYAWNYILSDSEYYLIDVAKAISIKNHNIKRDIDFYFGMNPEASIRLHFPNDSKWQLLPKIITKDEFKSMAYLDDGFYSLGFKTISPDIQSLNKTGGVRIVLTSDNSFDEIFDQIELLDMREEDEGSPWFGFPFDINKKSNGLYELYYDMNNAVFALIFARNKKTGEVSSFLFFDSK